MRTRLHSSVLWIIPASLLCLAAFGCSKGPETSTNPANDPAGLGTPQQRLEQLKNNTMMDPKLKAKKMQLLEDEINGTVTMPGRHRG